MTWIADLAAYNYVQSTHPNLRETAVGWLAAEHAFDRGPASPVLLDAIWEYCDLSFNQTRGLHDCEFCPQRIARLTERNGKGLRLGSAEIRVLATSGEIFAAPNLIYHYIESHDYQPPPRFIDAVISGPRPTSEEYLRALSAVGLVPSPTLRSKTD